MNIVKNTFVTLGLGFCLVFIPNCRGNIIPTEEELSDYGWIIYAEGDYFNARVWFGDAIKKDPLYNDSYNGMGWTMGHLRQADSSVYYFEKFLAIDTSFTNVLDFYAGLSFAYNAIGNDAKARTNCNIFFGKQNPILDAPWSFSHSDNINYLDVRLILAISEFRLGNFEDCQATINDIYTDETFINDIYNGDIYCDNGDMPIIVNEDLTTVIGRSNLACHIATLQKQLLNS